MATQATAATAADAFGDVGTVSVALAAVRPGAGPDTNCAGDAVPVARAGDAEPSATASLVKVYVIAELLHRDRAGELQLSGDDRALMEAMVVESDDRAMSELWVRHGGGRLVTDLAARYGLTGTAPPSDDPGQWGQTTTTAGDLACFFALLPSRAGTEDSALLLGWMRSTAPIAADGFDQRFGLFGAGDGEAAVKQGWSCCLDGIRVLHSAGILDGVAVALLARSGPEVGYPTLARGLTAAATTLAGRS
ncbi:serine hydrolase [Blastococcus sp. SYSU DS0617]